MAKLTVESMMVESMMHGYHKYISKLSLESELNLLKYCNVNILTSILTQNKLKRTSCCCARLMLQKWGIGEKSWRIVVIRQSFLLYGSYKSLRETIKAQLALLRAPHVAKQENWRKKLANCCDSPKVKFILLHGSK